MEGWTFEKVEGRLIEAAAVARRLPDREAGWLSVRAFWPDIVRERCLGDFDAYGYLGNSSDLPDPRLPLSPAQVSRMDACSGWIGQWVPDEADRRLLALALGWRAAGRRVSWRKLRRLLGANVREDALARRYDRIVAAIACGLAGKGRSGITAMVRSRLARSAREAVARGGGDGAGGAGRSVVRGRRRRQVVDIVYSD